MRYRPNRQYLYPVLRPDADDYGTDAVFEATCGFPQYDQSDGMVSISVRFDLNEPTLIHAVHSGKARCAAMVYCSSTLYRDRLAATPSEPFVAQGRIPVSRLKNDVQVHPVILSTEQLIHSTDTAHPEYQGQSVEIARLAPLATDLNWTFDIASDARPVRSIFRLREDTRELLGDGEFDLSLDMGQDYVLILANRNTLDAFKESGMRMPTVFTSAVLSVLAYIKELPEDTDDENCAWLRCVNTQLRAHNIDIGGPGYDGRDSLFLAAQRLLQSPFAAMLSEFSNSDDIDDSDGEHDAEEFNE